MKVRKNVARLIGLAAIIALFGTLSLKPDPLRVFQTIAAAVTATVTATATATATATTTATATPVVAVFPTPTVVAAPAGCASIAGLGPYTIGVSWCQDQSQSPYVLMVWNGVSFVRPAALTKGVTPPSTAPDTALWLNTNDYPPVLEQCSASTCSPARCLVGVCGIWNPLMIPNYGPLASPVP